MDKTFLQSFLLITLIFLGLQPSWAEESTQANLSSQPPQTVNINTDDAEAIALVLGGIGLAKARAIVEYREKFGDFAVIEELADVKGIGEKTLEKNIDKISLN